MPLIQTPNGENFQVHVVLFQTNDDLLQLGFSKEVAQRIEEADSSRSIYRFFSMSDAMPNKDHHDPSTECIAVHLEEGDEKNRLKGFRLVQELLRDKMHALFIESNLDASLDYAFLEGLSLSCHKPERLGDSKSSPINWSVGYRGKVSSDALESLDIVCESNFIARDLVNLPQNFLNPTTYGKRVKELGSELGFEVKLHDKAAIESMKMGGVLAVNRGSIEPPVFIEMHYCSPNSKNKKPVVLVGKGVTYDTGGLSLKPTKNSMDFMKADMAGSAAVVGTMCALARQQADCNVIGLVAATDNRPGGDAYAPGDVITMMDGTTVEVLNTDAEGRLTLADALHYAKQFEPKLVIDLATLTGSAVAALGGEAAALMTSCEKDITASLVTSADSVDERLVEFPLWECYGTSLKSDIADQKNVGSREAGLIIAGKFLEKYIDYPWMHIDIAGPSFNHQAKNYRGKGGSGYGVRLLLDFLKSWD